ncbi:LOW QUALITY PROTEIN: protein YIPF1 [Pangasianodon hypophthalmus]|uniref:LOW QUALITY PROTEIN: protein YIPF1 n=1 Tax=Pangasianodon hypophthalmus TaxID=310915 RepID=UPI002306DD3D|nr:LOW QUALITY PROTEIN: protein YIPF1 [Pangasianodon hypophthalmus]
MANTDFHLQFQDFDDDVGVTEGSGGATVVSMDGERFGKSPTQRRVAGGEDELLDGDDQTELLRSERKSAAFWTLEFYQTFFNVDTYQVMDRIISSVLPWRGKNFVRLHIRNNPDLYGPFWICATLVFAIGVSGNMSSFLVHHGQPRYKYVPEFRKVTMAATAIYSYAWLVPLALWCFLTWRSRKISSTLSYSFLEIVCVYGYSLSIYIPAVVLWVVPSEVLRWSSIVVALCLSGSVLVLTFWPVMRDDRPRVVLAVLSSVVALHVLLAIGCKAYFFSTYETETVEKLTAETNAVQNLTSSKTH